MHSSTGVRIPIEQLDVQSILVVDGVHGLADGMDASTVVDRLERRHIRASVTPYAVEYARLGTSLHVDAADVDAAVGSVKALQG